MYKIRARIKKNLVLSYEDHKIFYLKESIQAYYNVIIVSRKDLNLLTHNKNCDKFYKVTKNMKMVEYI
jgi:hypothetical protein